MPFKVAVFEPSKLVTTKTLLLKHYYRHQGLLEIREIFSSKTKGRENNGAAGYCPKSFS